MYVAFGMVIKVVVLTGQADDFEPRIGVLQLIQIRR